MELKIYQQGVIKNLRDYLKVLATLKKGQHLQDAWKLYWQAQDIAVGKDGVPFYRDEIVGVPHVCMKVPTGGGKTFLACASLKEIFSTLEIQTNRMVVWLVPSRPILQQTLKNLQNPEHPYRQLLERDFYGRVSVLTKDMMLTGQNFSPDTVREMLTICVLSYDSLRIDKLKKEERKVYQENGSLKSFSDAFANKRDELLQGTDDTALIQVLRHLQPVTIVDESHNAESDYSVEMLNNLNPSFVLDLTATPRAKSNIISYVDARELKKENMVKLPVVVYNRSRKQDVYQDAIQLRAQLETIAKKEQEQSGAYIRPIVLFQAQPNKKEAKDRETFDKVRDLLIKMGIPQEQIAVKTADIDELKEQDLLSPDCPIRFIITVNALKEGWDCPFAYILASLANKNSRVDVEQILGRILRQPYAKRTRQSLLNASYVLTCSNDFYETLEQIVKGLNHAGFSQKDYRVANPLSAERQPVEDQPPEQLALSFPAVPGTTDATEAEPAVSDVRDAEDDDAVNPEAVREAVTETGNIPANIQNLLENANTGVQTYERETRIAEKEGVLGGELGAMLKQQKIQRRFRQQIQAMRLPVFSMEEKHANLFSFLDDAKAEWKPLTLEQLSKDFSLAKLPVDISFELSTGEIYEVDLSKEDEGIPKYKQASLHDREVMQQILARLPEEARVHQCELKIAELVNRNNRYATKEVNAYVYRVIENMQADEISALENAYPVYAKKIEEKIKSYEKIYQGRQFQKLLEVGKIKCRPLYEFPAVITPAETISSIPKSLYTAERSDMNSFELEAINKIVGLENVLWWHRVIDRKDKEFYLNGFMHHYPDFIVQTIAGNTILVETKGEHLANDDSRAKLRLGKQWAALAGEHYRYFMVFKEKSFAYAGAYSLDEFIAILHEL